MVISALQNQAFYKVQLFSKLTKSFETGGGSKRVVAVVVASRWI
jgi:hypothetical protein